MQIYTNCIVGKCLLHRCALYDGVNLSFSSSLPEKKQDIVSWVVKLLE